MEGLGGLAGWRWLFVRPSPLQLALPEFLLTYSVFISRRAGHRGSHDGRRRRSLLLGSSRSPLQDALVIRGRATVRRLALGRRRHGRQGTFLLQSLSCLSNLLDLTLACIGPLLQDEETDVSKWQAVKLVLKDWKILLLILQQVRRM